jgi:hypothetical protein
MKKIIVIISLISNFAYGQNAVHLNQGDKAPFDGNLLTESTTQRLYNDSLDKSSLQKQLDLSNSSNALLQQDKTLLLDQNGKLIKAAQSEKSLSDLEKGLYFLGGILVTALAVKAAASLHP